MIIGCETVNEPMLHSLINCNLSDDFFCLYMIKSLYDSDRTEYLKFSLERCLLQPRSLKLSIDVCCLKAKHPFEYVLQ